MRVQKAKIDHVTQYQEYYANDQSWKPGYNADDAKVIITEGFAEGSVRYNGYLKKWVYIYANYFESGSIQVKIADHFLGPWSKSQVLYKLPKAQSRHPTYNKNLRFYAAKEHAQYADQSTAYVVITYVTNTNDLKQLMNDQSIYVPKKLIISLDFLKARL